MIQNFLSGLLTGLNSSPVIKYSFISLIILVFILKITKWWGTFKKKV